MKSYLITRAAPRRLAGHRNTGVGTLLMLAEDKAATPLAAGWIIPANPAPAEIAAEATEPVRDGQVDAAATHTAKKRGRPSAAKKSGG